MDQFVDKFEKKTASIHGENKTYRKPEPFFFISLRVSTYELVLESFVRFSAFCWKICHEVLKKTINEKSLVASDNVGFVTKALKLMQGGYPEISSIIIDMKWLSEDETFDIPNTSHYGNNI